MYDYFPNNYNWSLALYSVSSMGLPLSFIGRVASQLSEYSDPADPRAPERWYQTWMALYQVPLITTDAPIHGVRST